MRLAKNKLLFLALFCNNMHVYATIIDNRYFPLYQKIFPRTLDRRSFCELDLFFSSSKDALNKHHETIGLPEIYGTFDQRILSSAIELTEKQNPLRIDLRNSTNIPWKTSGKITSEGFNLYLEKSLNDYLSLGFNTGLMHVDSRIIFNPTTQPIYLDNQRRAALNLLSLQAPQWNDTQLLDSELFIKVGKIWEYSLKTRRLDLNAQFGFIFPTSLKRDINNPASIPFGGNGHKGITGSISLDTELKDDLSFGISVLFNKRFPKSDTQRLSLLEEPYIYGAVIESARVSPGLTIGLSPYLIAQGLYDGLGAYIRYIYIHHLCDSWSINRGRKNIPANLKTVISTSQWTSEYFSFNIFYDFNQYSRASVVIDIPVDLLGARLNSKTYRVSLGCETSF